MQYYLRYYYTNSTHESKCPQNFKTKFPKLDMDQDQKRKKKTCHTLAWKSNVVLVWATNYNRVRHIGQVRLSPNQLIMQLVWNICLQLGKTLHEALSPNSSKQIAHSLNNSDGGSSSSSFSAGGFVNFSTADSISRFSSSGSIATTAAAVSPFSRPPVRSASENPCS